MFEIIKNSLVIVKNNPFLTLGFVLYLIVLSFVLPRLETSQSGLFVILFLFAILLVSAGFLSGWFGVIKSAVKNSYKIYADEEARIADALSSKGSFFESVSKFIVPVGTMIVLYCVLFALLLALGFKFATKFIGSISFLKDALNIVQPEQMAEYLKNLGPDKKLIVSGWNLFFSLLIGLFSFLTVFWPAAIYWGKNGSRNPILALWYSATAIFRKPLGVIGLNLFIILLSVLLMPIAALSSLNPITAFIYMILTIYTFVFIVVLTFNYYEQRLKPRETKINSGDGPDSIREEQPGA